MRRQHPGGAGEGRRRVKGRSDHRDRITALRAVHDAELPRQFHGIAWTEYIEKYRGMLLSRAASTRRPHWPFPRAGLP